MSTSTLLAPAELVAGIDYAVCPRCSGAGVTGTGAVEAETGVLCSVECTGCSGDGTVHVDLAWQCDDCAVWYWDEDGCQHDRRLCDSCRPGCSLCVFDAREASAYGGGADR